MCFRCLLEFRCFWLVFWVLLDLVFFVVWVLLALFGKWVCRFVRVSVMQILCTFECSFCDTD